MFETSVILYAWPHTLQKINRNFYCVCYLLVASITARPSARERLRSTFSHKQTRVVGADYKTCLVFRTLYVTNILTKKDFINVVKSSMR